MFNLFIESMATAYGTLNVGPLKFGTQLDNNCAYNLYVGYCVTSKAANM